MCRRGGQEYSYSAGSAGRGIGGGVYFASGGSVCLGTYTASTSNNDIFGNYTLCSCAKTRPLTRISHQ
jgi:hypothetical protein